MPPPFIILDLSGLIHAVRTRALTGVPRVELAYAQHLIATVPERLRFSALDAFGRLRLLDNRLAIAFIDDVTRYWTDGIGSPPAYRRLLARALHLHAVLLCLPGRSLTRFVAKCGRRCIYVVPGQLVLNRASLSRALKDSGDVKLVYFVHDVLALDFPEYFPRGVEDFNRQLVENAARFADIVIVNSQATAGSLSARFGAAFPRDRMVIAPLGTSVRIGTATPTPPTPSASPYFVLIGTIEPRKNHLMVLSVWQALREALGPATPRLVLIGRRGWLIQDEIDLLERSPALQGIVEERGTVSDRDVAAVLSGARALLLPSFAEGYGLPLAEALAAGVPVICSDIPVFREVGGAAPDYLDPRDSAGWSDAVRDYCDSDSPRRGAQLRRIGDWVPPTWEQHFARVMPVINALDGQDHRAP